MTSGCAVELVLFKTYIYLNAVFVLIQIEIQVFLIVVLKAVGKI